MDRNIADLSDDELVKLRAVLEMEAARRGLSVGIGELGEQIAIDLFKERPDLPSLMRAARGTKNVDALSRAGERYSIKTLSRAKKTGTIYPDDKDPKKRLFEWLMIVILSGDLGLESIVLLSWEQFESVRCWDRRMSAWYVPRTKRALAIGRTIHPSNVS